MKSISDKIYVWGFYMDAENREGTFDDIYECYSSGSYYKCIIIK